MPTFDEMWDADRQAKKAAGNGHSFGGSDNGGDATRAVAGILADLALQTTGKRNEMLNWAAYTAAGYVAGGHYNGDLLVEQLTRIALVIGLEQPEIGNTIKSGMTAGAEVIRHPRAGHRDVPPAWAFPNATPADGEDQWEAVRQALPRIDWHQLWAQPDDEEWIVFPLLPARRLISLYSPPKVGKSLLMLELAAAVASGRPALGNRAEQPRNVLYVDFENDPRTDTRERLQDMGYGPDDLERLILLSFPSLSWLDTEAGGAELVAAAHAYAAEAVIIDTVSRSVRGEENDNDTWLNFYRYTGMALKQAKIACGRLDHAGKDITKGQRGGSAKAGDVDAIWRMTKLDDDHIQLKAEGIRFGLAPGWQQLTLQRTADPLGHKVTSESAPSIAEQNAIKILDELGVPNTGLGRDKIRKLYLDKNHIEIRNGPLAAAIRTRKNRIQGFNLSPGQVRREDQQTAWGQDGDSHAE